MTRRPSPPMLVALLALFLAAGGGQAVASGVAHLAKLIDGSKIKPSTITSKQVKDRSLLGKDFKAGELPAGAKGEAGPKGDPGAPGAKGDTGATGTVDTSNFYTKAQSDGNYLGKTAAAANALTLGGSSPSTFTRGQSTAVGGNMENFTMGTNDNAFLAIDGLGELSVDCGPMGTGVSVTYVVQPPGGVMGSQNVDAMVTGANPTASTAQATTTGLGAGSTLPILSAMHDANALRHMTVSVADTLQGIAATFDLTVVNAPTGGSACRATGTWVKQGGIGTF